MITIGKNGSNLSAYVTDPDAISGILNLLRSLETEKTVPYMVRTLDDGSLYITTEEGWWGTAIKFNDYWSEFYVFTDTNGKTDKIYFLYDYIYADGVLLREDGYWDLRPRIDHYISGSEIHLDFSKPHDFYPGWPEHAISSTGEQQVESIIVGVSPLAYKEVTRVRDLKLTGDHYLLNSSWDPLTTDYSRYSYPFVPNESMRAHVFSPDATRLDVKDLEEPGRGWYWAAFYPIFYHEGNYYLGYYEFLDLQIEAESARALLDFIGTLDYPLETDTRSPSWWGQRSTLGTIG